MSCDVQESENYPKPEVLFKPTAVALGSAAGRSAVVDIATGVFCSPLMVADHPLACCIKV